MIPCLHPSTFVMIQVKGVPMRYKCNSCLREAVAEHWFDEVGKLVKFVRTWIDQ